MPYGLYPMAHPWHHSLSSVRTFSGTPEDYLDLHSWFDQTKSCYADFRHRALRHHIEGIALSQELFGKTITNSLGLEVSVEKVGLQHIAEDCGRVVSCQDWFSAMGCPSWFKNLPSREGILQRLEKHYRINPQTSSPIVEWFYAPQAFIDGSLWPALRSHAEGIFLAETVFGKVVIENDNNLGKVHPTRFIAEQIVKLQLGRIPSAQDWLKHIKPAAWMVTTAKIEKILLEINS
jgi:hypothetical protein